MGKWRCRCGAEPDVRVQSCPDCGTMRAPTRAESEPSLLPGDSRDPARCHWRGSRGARCLMRSVLLTGAGEQESRYCGWHEELRRPDRARLAEDFAEFERWCLRLRDRGYCGEHFDWSHADPGWLFELVTGDTSTPLEPPPRTGCANTACPYGWNGKRLADAFPPPIARATAARPLAGAVTEALARSRDRPARAWTRGFAVVYRTPDAWGYRCLTCRTEFGREPAAPPPTRCPSPRCPTQPPARESAS